MSPGRWTSLLTFCKAIASSAYSMSSTTATVWPLLKIIWEKDKPINIRCDKGPEFISHEFQDWCDGNGIKILYTQPGCPTQNSYIERFNGSYRRAVLDAYIFRTLDDVREITEKWTDYYNNERPHDSLNNLAPLEYRLMRTG